MRELGVGQLTANIKEMCIEANHNLSPDMVRRMEEAVGKEESALGKQILEQLQENLEIADKDGIPICQGHRYGWLYFWKWGRRFILLGEVLRMRYTKACGRDIGKVI